MATIEQQLTELVNQKNTLVNNLNTMGVEAATSETLNTLVPKVLDIETGGGSGGVNPAIIERTLTEITADDLAGVTKISDYAFYRYDTLLSLTIPDSVKSIGDDAFSGCSSLTSVSIGEGVKSIGDRAFYECYILTSITIPNSIESIGNSAFSFCSGLTSALTIPNSVTSIGNLAFSGCYKLVQIKNLSGQTLSALPRNVGQEILTDETSAFTNTLKNEGNYQTFVVGDKKYLMGFTAEADRTTADDIPSDITDIYQYAFYECSSLTSVSLGDSVTSIGNSAFSFCSGLTGALTIPDSVTSIGDNAFRSCTGLTSITIPDSVTSIGDAAFSFCSGLTIANIYTTSSTNKITAYYRSWFYYCESTLKLHIPASVTSPTTAYGSYWNYYSSSGKLTYYADL